MEAFVNWYKVVCVHSTEFCKSNLKVTKEYDVVRKGGDDVGKESSQWLILELLWESGMNWYANWR